MILTAHHSTDLNISRITFWIFPLEEPGSSSVDVISSTWISQRWCLLIGLELISDGMTSPAWNCLRSTSPHRLGTVSGRCHLPLRVTTGARAEARQCTRPHTPPPAPHFCPGMRAHSSISWVLDPKGQGSRIKGTWRNADRGSRGSQASTSGGETARSSRRRSANPRHG